MGQWGEEVVVGTGEIDWVAFVRILTEAGYQGDYDLRPRGGGADRVGDIAKGIARPGRHGGSGLLGSIPCFQFRRLPR